jgi:hypothetical protein
MVERVVVIWKSGEVGEVRAVWIVRRVSGGRRSVSGVLVP